MAGASWDEVCKGFGVNPGNKRPARDFGFRTKGISAGLAVGRVGWVPSSGDGGRHLRTGRGVFKTRSIGKIPARSDFSIIAHSIAPEPGSGMLDWTGSDAGRRSMSFCYHPFL